MNKNKYWFNLNSDTFLWKSGEDILLYNTEVQKSLTFKNNNELNKLIVQLQDIDNLYCIELTRSEFNNSLLNPFIKQIVGSQFGNIQEAIDRERKPAFFVPVLKLQNKMNKVDHFVKENNNMLSYLHEIKVHLNEIQINDSSYIEKQGKVQDIPFEDLVSFLKTFTNCISLNSIGLCGEELLEYPQIEELMDELNENKITKILHLPFGHLVEGTEDILTFKKKPDQIVVIVPPVIEPDKFSSVYERCKLLKVDMLWQFNILSEGDYLKAEGIVDDYKLEKYTVLPVFNGKNQGFFEEFIYLTEEDIQTTKLSKREIFAHQVLNTNYFGELTIKANGAVHANPYMPPLGTIKDPINNMLCKELSGSSSWLKIRDMQPCCSCIYQWLCPSPNDFELAIGKPNLCHLSNGRG